MTATLLKKYSYGKVVIRLNSEKFSAKYPARKPVSPRLPRRRPLTTLAKTGARDAAATLTTKWKNMVARSDETELKSPSPVESKRKIPVPPSDAACESSCGSQEWETLTRIQAAVAVKKRKVEPIKSSAAKAAAAAASSTAVADSLFSTRTPSTSLPSARKGKARATDPPPAPAAPPARSTEASAFERAMAVMKGRDNPTPGAEAQSMTSTGDRLPTKVKPKKSVRWKAEEELKVVHTVPKLDYLNEDGTVSAAQPWIGARG